MMKKKILSIALTLCMLLSLFPPVALAEVPLQAQWGAVGDDGIQWVSSGTLSDAMDYANGLATPGAIAYIQLKDNIDSINHPTWPVTFAKGKTTILDLNGYDIDRKLTRDTLDGNVLSVEGKLTLKDSSTDIVADQGRITGGNNMNFTGLKHGGGVLVDSYTDAIFIIQGGNITGNIDASNQYAGGGVFVGVGANCYMEGGSIAGNQAMNIGGGVYLGQGNFYMTGGTITGNHSRTGGV